MTKKPEYVEGSEAWDRFRAATAHALTVSHDEIQQRIARARKEAEANPHKRGPKRKG